MKRRIPFTGASGRSGEAGRTVVEILRQRKHAVRIFDRRADKRSNASR